MRPLHLNFLQFLAMVSFMGVRFSLTKILVLAWKLYFSLLNFKRKLDAWKLACHFNDMPRYTLAWLQCQCRTKLISQYSLNYYQTNSQEYHWKLHYCACDTEPNQYDLILLWQLFFKFLPFHLQSLAFSSVSFR